MIYMRALRRGCEIKSCDVIVITFELQQNVWLNVFSSSVTHVK